MKLRLLVNKKGGTPLVGESIRGCTFRTIDPIPFETLEALHKEVLDRLDAREGADPARLDGIDFDSPAYNQAKDRLNQVWLGCLEGKATVADFREALAQYEQVVLADTGAMG